VSLTNMGESLAQERQMKSYIALSTCHYKELQKSTQQFSQVAVRKELIGNLRGERRSGGVEHGLPGGRSSVLGVCCHLWAC
jgi:hypothetical protein